MAEMTTLRAYLDELDRLLDQEAPTEVISHCRHILQNFPHNVETYRMLGKALLLKANQEDATELFEEAAEVFRRVLSVLPNDYVAHLGLSEISDHKDDLNRAIWHLERAYEQMPGNAALQDALRELYVKRDGADRAPTRIQLTRGALARQYIQGQLYEQAIAELRAALAQQPERLDLQTLLAEALWASHHEVEAGEVAIELLKRLPNNLAANRIMAQLWLQNERPTDARPFLDRVEALDPYLAARILKPDGDLPGEIELPRLDYYHQSQAMLSAETPGWVQELGTPGQDISMEDLFTVPGQQAPVVDQEAPAESSELDMAALFGEVPVPDVSNLWASNSLTPDSGQYHPPSSEALDDFPVPDVSWFDEAGPAAAEETDEAAIEADWVLETDEHSASEPPPAESSGAPVSPSLAEADLWEELQSLDDALSAVPSLEQLTSEEDTVLPLPMETLDWPQERPPSPESAPADFLEQLGETPDFAELGTEEIDWSVFESLTEEADTQATERAALPSQPPSLSGGLPPEEASASAESPTQLPWEETAERVLDAALDHPDEQHLHAQIDAAFEEILAAEQLIEEAGESISTPEWLPSPEELVGQITSETPRDIPSLGELAAAMDEELPTEPEALDESLQWLDASLDSQDPDLLAALAAAGQAETSAGAEALAEPAPEIPDWLREAAPLPERATTEEIAQLDSAMVWPAEEPSLTSEAAVPSWVEKEPVPQADWETLEATQSVVPGQPVESTADEAEVSHVASEEDWLRIFAQQDEEPLPESQQEAASAEEAPGAMSDTDDLPLPQGEFTDEQTIDEHKQGEEPLPPTESWKPDLEKVENEISISAEPGWLADWPAPEAPSPSPDEELAALLSQPYDPFEGGSPENVPRYQAASETGILQPDEQPDWMTAFLGGELPETDRLPESTQEQAVTRPLSEEESLPEAEWSEETPLSSEEIAPTEEWAAEQPAPTEDVVPDWLMAIADSEADKLAELFSSDEFFTPQEEELAGIQETSSLEEPGEGELAMPETHEAFFAPTAEEMPDVAAAAQALPEEVQSFVPESETEATLPPTDEYADEPVPEDFSFGDWVPIWLRAPLEGQPEDLLNQNRDIPPAPPEWLRDVAEEDE